MTGHEEPLADFCAYDDGRKMPGGYRLAFCFAMGHSRGSFVSYVAFCRFSLGRRFHTQRAVDARFALPSYRGGAEIFCMPPLRDRLLKMRASPDMLQKTIILPLQPLSGARRW